MKTVSKSKGSLERSEDSFVHLRVHSEYSISDGLIKLSQLADSAGGKGMPAVGLTDSGNLFKISFH